MCHRPATATGVAEEARLSSFVPPQRAAHPACLSYVIAAGATIDASTVGPSFLGSMAYGGANPNARFANASNKFVGLSFASGANRCYGWVRVSVNNAAGTLVIHDWAYENSSAGITAGTVPAPGALALLAVGAGGLGILRGRKRSYARRLKALGC